MRQRLDQAIPHGKIIDLQQGAGLRQAFLRPRQVRRDARHGCPPLRCGGHRRCGQRIGIVQASEIRLEDRRIALNIGRRPLGKLCAKVHNDQMIGQAHDEVHVVLHQKDAETFVAQLTKHAREILLFLVSQPGGRLVEQQQQGIRCERPRDFQDALLA